MQVRVFTIPMDGDPDAIEELNAFLRGQKVLSVEKVGAGNQYAAIAEHDNLLLPFHRARRGKQCARLLPWKRTTAAWPQ